MLKSSRLTWAGVVLFGTASCVLGGNPSPRRPAADLGVQLAPDTTFITSPLDDLGYPDYVRALNERQAASVSRDENFWVLMWPAIGNAERTREDFIAAVEHELQITIPREPQLTDPVISAGLAYGTPEGDKLSERWTKSMQHPWTRAEAPEIARWIDAHAAQLEQIHAACARPKSYAPLISSTGASMVSILLPHVQAQRSAARLLYSRAMLRLGEGDSDGCWQDLLAGYRLARHTEAGWTLIEQLVGYAIRAMAQAPLAHWLSQPDLTPEVLQQRWTELQPLLPTESLAEQINYGERSMYLDTVLYLFSGGGSAKEMLSMVEPVTMVISGEDVGALASLRSAREMAFQLLFLGADVNATLRHGNKTYDELVASLQPATHVERKVLMDAFETDLKKDVAELRSPGGIVKEYLFASNEDFRKIPGRVLISLLVPAIHACETAQTRSEAYAAALEAAFRLRMQFARTGELPVSVEELAATVASLPLDPFTGESLKLAVDDRGIVLYSVGMNGADDNGKPHGEGDNADDVRIVLNLAP